MLSLWRLNAMKYPDCPPTKGTHWRVSSPTSGRSILMTRAPRSAKTMVQYGPERTRDMSMTVMPSSGGFCSASEGRRTLISMAPTARHSVPTLAVHR